MAHKRKTFSASVSSETAAKLAAITEDVQRGIGVPIHVGIILDTLVQPATSEVVLSLIREGALRLTGAEPKSRQQPVPEAPHA